MIKYARGVDSVDPVVWFNGSIRENQSIPVRPEAGLWRGSGWFETLAVWDGQVLNFEYHADRLSRSIVESIEDRLNRLREDVPRLIEQFGKPQGQLKIVVWESGSGMNLGAWVTDYQSPSRADWEDGVGLDVVKSSHPPRWPLSGEKRTSYAGVMARRNQASGWGVLYCDLNGDVRECGIANVVWWNGTELVVPPVDDEVLEGTVLRAVRERNDLLDGPVVEKPFHWREPDSGLWVLNSLIGILPVRSLENRSLSIEDDDPVRLTLRPNLGSDKVIPRWYNSLQ